MTQPHTIEHDQLTRFLLPHAGVRGVIVQLQDSWQQMRTRNDYPPVITELLGEAAAASALFTGHAKVEGRLSLQMRGEGTIRTLFAECTSAGTLRGIVRHAGDAASRELRGLLGQAGVLAITIENPTPGDREPVRYQGIVSVDAASLAEACEAYFRDSEQLPTRLLLAADGQRATGLMLQKLPGDGGDDDGWARANALFDTLGETELLGTDPATLLHRLFHEEQPEWLGSRSLRFACSCSRERVEAMLQSLGREEAQAAVIDGQAEVICEFCGQHYHFTGADIAAVLESAPPGQHPAPAALH